jgi:UDP-galactopyranose mutase
MKTVLIIGGGFAGCAAAHQLVLMDGWDVTLVEAAPFLGAGVRTTWFGGHPHTFGPRHFLTPHEHLFTFLNKYVPLRRIHDHEAITYVEKDQAFYNFPIHKDDIPRMPDAALIHQEIASASGAAEAKNLEEYWIGSVGPTLYEKFIKGYSQKMWQIEDNRMIDIFHWSPKGVALKEGPRAAWDTAISAYPYAPNGYDDYFDVATQEARVYLCTTIEHYDIPNKTVVMGGEGRTFDVIINTISPDVLFDYAYGELPYIGRDFHRIVLPVEHCFPENVYFLYYAKDEQFTRLVEYKKFTLHKSPTTLIGMEIPSRNGKYYPLPIKAEMAKAQRYLDEMPEGVFSIGRAGSYRYEINIDDTIEQAMKVAEKLK